MEATQKETEILAVLFPEMGSLSMESREATFLFYYREMLSSGAE